MPPASTPPSLPESGAPVSLLVDFDGTISLVDVGDALLAGFASDMAAVHEKDALYGAGVLGSRELMRWDMDVLPADPALLRREATAMPLDPTFVDLVAVTRSNGGVVEVVSDGLGFYVEDMLCGLGLDDIPVATNATSLVGGGEGMSFPYGHPDCFVCGTCKRSRVFEHRAARRVVILVGDGTSDRYAAAHADIVFAKAGLARICAAAGWPYRPWERLSDVAAWLEGAFEDGRLPTDAASYAEWRGGMAERSDAFICGPEVWGEGRTAPPDAGRRPAAAAAHESAERDTADRSWSVGRPRRSP